VIAEHIPFSIYFLNSWLVEKFGIHQIAINPAKLVEMTKYTSAELAKYFNESQANVLFRNPKRIIISPALLPLTKVVVLHYDDNLSVLKSDYFMCIRFGYLTFCYDDTFIIEPYYPDRFSR
jgi:hypothetical protein